MNKTVITEVVEHMEKLPDDLQRQVLTFVQELESTVPQGIPGDKLLRFAGAIPPEELQLMSRAIENGCEQVDSNEW